MNSKKKEKRNPQIHTCTPDLIYRLEFIQVFFFCNIRIDLHHFTMASNRSKTNSNRNCSKKRQHKTRCCDSCGLFVKSSFLFVF